VAVCRSAAVCRQPRAWPANRKPKKRATSSFNRKPVHGESCVVVAAARFYREARLRQLWQRACRRRNESSMRCVWAEVRQRVQAVNKRALSDSGAQRITRIRVASELYTGLRSCRSHLSNRHFQCATCSPRHGHREAFRRRVALCKDFELASLLGAMISVLHCSRETGVEKNNRVVALSQTTVLYVFTNLLPSCIILMSDAYTKLPYCVQRCRCS
jgi:hypothetical protein